MSFPSGRHFLQIPGPTNVPERILRAMARPTIDHRGPEFARLALELLDGLKEVFQTTGKIDFARSISSSITPSIIEEWNDS